MINRQAAQVASELQGAQHHFQQAFLCMSLATLKAEQMPTAQGLAHACGILRDTATKQLELNDVALTLARMYAAGAQPTE